MKTTENQIKNRCLIKENFIKLVNILPNGKFEPVKAKLSCVILVVISASHDVGEHF